MIIKAIVKNKTFKPRNVIHIQKCIKKSWDTSTHIQKNLNLYINADKNSTYLYKPLNANTPKNINEISTYLLKEIYRDASNNKPVLSVDIKFFVKDTHYLDKFKNYTINILNLNVKLETFTIVYSPAKLITKVENLPEGLYLENNVIQGTLYDPLEGHEIIVYHPNDEIIKLKINTYYYETEEY